MRRCSQKSSLQNLGCSGTIILHQQPKPPNSAPWVFLVTSASCWGRRYVFSRLCRVRGFSVFCSKRCSRSKTSWSGRSWGQNRTAHENASQFTRNLTQPLPRDGKSRVTWVRQQMSKMWWDYRLDHGVHWGLHCMPKGTAFWALSKPCSPWLSFQFCIYNRSKLCFSFSFFLGCTMWFF